MTNPNVSLHQSDSAHWAVVLAGGDGTRLQSLTRVISGEPRPKQFCPFFDGKSLLTHTRERIAPLFAERRTVFALARAHEAYHREELAEVDARRRVVQPANRGTAVAMARCLQPIALEDPGAVVAFLPSDHHYADCAAFRATIRAALRVARERPERIVIVGAAAEAPEVEYGWIEPGLPVEGVTVRRVSRFVEKPSLSQARMLLAKGCLWNTFVTVGQAGAFQRLMLEAAPQLARVLQHPAGECAQQLYAGIDSVDFSRDVLTRFPERLLVVRDSASGWTDLGSPRRIVDVITRHDMRPSWLSFRQEDARAFR